MFARFIYLLVSFFDADRRELSRLRQEVRNLERRNRRQQVIIAGSHRNNDLLRQEVTAQGKALRRLKAGQRQQPKFLAADAATKAMLDQLKEDTRRWRDSGLSLEAIRDLVNRWQSDAISFGRLVEELRLAASVAAAENAQSVLDGISRSLVAAVRGHEHYDAPPLHWSQALKLACDEIEDLRKKGR